MIVPKRKVSCLSKLTQLFVLSLLLVGFGFPQPTDAAEPEVLHLAVVGPMDSPSSAGKSFLQAAQLFADSFNLENEQEGFTVELTAFDDANDPKQAQKIAASIATDPKFLGVIGHNFSGASIAAAPVYKKNGLVALTPTSTNDSVTKDNPWFFRDIFSDAYQGKFLAEYSKTMLAKDRVAVLYESDAYGSFLAEQFQIEAKRLGAEIPLYEEYPTEPGQLTSKLAQIKEALEGVENIGLLVIFGHNKELIPIVRYLRDNNFYGDILLPDTAAKASFVSGFKGLPKELQNPGYYTDGIYVAAPLLYDSASQAAQKFAKNFQETYSHAPDWRAAYAYDAALLLAQAAKIGGIFSLPPEQRREGVRKQLSAFSQLNQAIPGITGLNYFDESGDMTKPLSIGQYRHSLLTSAPLQMRSAGDPRRIIGLEERVKAGMIAKIDDSLFHRTFVVYTGVDIKELSEMNHEAGTYTLEFDLWFRYQRGIDVRDIDFCNSTAPIKLRMPAEEVAYGKQIYRRYRVKGTFTTDFVDPRFPTEHSIGVCFVHKKLDRSNLIFVADVIGGADSFRPSTRKERLDYRQSTGWSAQQFWNNQQVMEKPIQGNINYIHETSKQIPFSSYHSGVTLVADDSWVRNALSPEYAFFVLLACTLLWALFEHRLGLKYWSMPLMNLLFGPTVRVIEKVSEKPQTGFFYAHEYGEKKIEVERPRRFHPSHFSWAIKSLAILGVFYNFEIIVTHYLFHYADPERLRAAAQTFDILWWMVPTLILIRGVENFVWQKIEESTDREIPNFAKVFFAATVLCFSMFGMLAFVYGETVTSILGASGIFVMIIGMAVQMNISNIFAGLVLNFEKSIKVGDWVAFDGVEEGKVIDIYWRTIQVMQRNGSMVSIPNNSISESSFQNYSNPNRVIEQVFEINLYKDQDYYHVVKVLKEAMSSVDEVLDTPPPDVRFSDYTHWSACWTCAYSFADYGRKRFVHAKVWEQIVKQFAIHDIHTADFKEEPEI